MMGENGRKPLDEIYSWPELYERVCGRVPELRNTRGYKDFFMRNQNRGYLFDPLMQKRAFTMHQDMKARDRDHFVLIVGKEGLGKSTFAIQIGSWVDPEFSNDNIAFTPQDYVAKLKHAKKGSIIVLDEGGVATFSREALTQSNINMVKLFMLQRQMNVSVIACCPSFWDIDTYLRRHRINTLIRLISPGAYCGYLPKAVSIINELGYSKKPLTKIRVPNGSFWHGKFNKRFPKCIDRAQYLKDKRAHLDNYINSLEFDFGVPKMILASKAAKEMGLSSSQMIKRIQKGTITAKKIGARYFISRETYEDLLRF